MPNALIQSMKAGRQIGTDIQRQGRSRQLRNALASGDMRSAMQADPKTALAFQQEQRLQGQFQNKQQQQQMKAQQQQMESGAREVFTIARTLQTLPPPLARQYYERIKPQLVQAGVVTGQEDLSIEEIKEQAKLIEAQMAPIALGGMSDAIQKEYFNLDEDKGGPVITLQGPDGKRISRRRDDPEVDKLLQQGYEQAPSRQQVEQGEPGSFGTSSTEIRQLRDKMAAGESFVATAEDAISMLQENPDINTFTASASGLINDLQQEVKAFARNTGMDIEPKALDERTYGDSFDKLGIENRRMRSLITSLAFKAAAASGQSGRSVSDRDVRRFIEEVGATSSDPRAFAATLTDLAERTIRDIRISARVRGLDVEDRDFGLSRLPAFEAGGDKQGSDADIVYEMDENGNLVRVK